MAGGDSRLVGAERLECATGAMAQDCANVAEPVDRVGVGSASLRRVLVKAEDLDSAADFLYVGATMDTMGWHKMTELQRNIYRQQVLYVLQLCGLEPSRERLWG